MENEQFDDSRPRFWRAIDEIQKENIVFKEKLRVIEDSFSRHLDFHDGMARSMESIRAKLEENGHVLVAVKMNQENNKKEIESLWAFPLKAVGFIVALGGSSTVAYKVAKWLISSTDIRIIK